MNYRLPAKSIIYSAIFLIAVLVVWLAISVLKPNFSQIFSSRNNLQASLVGDNPLDANAAQNPIDTKPSRDWNIQDTGLNAEAGVCVELSASGPNKVLFKQNENEKLPIASLTKLMSAVVVLENYDMGMVTAITKGAVMQPGEQGLLSVGEYLSLENLLYIMLIESSNDAAYSLAEVMGQEKFVGVMNSKAKELGLLETNFADPSGLSSDNYSTADELVKLTSYITSNYPEIWEILSKDNYRLLTPSGKLHHELKNTNELLTKVPDMVAGKTGNTDEAKGCLLLLLKNPTSGDNLIYILLGSDDRFGEMQQLIDWINKAYSW